MGLRRRLSKKWNETVNGVLSGPGVDVDSVNTDDLQNNIEGADDTTESVVTYPSDNIEDSIDRSRVVRGVSTSATLIAEGSADSAAQNIAIVSGRDGQQSAFFWDIVQFARFSSPNVIATNNGGNPDSRTYSKNGKNLELAMSAGSYDVRTRCIENGGI